MTQKEALTHIRTIVEAYGDIEFNNMTLCLLEDWAWRYYPVKPGWTGGQLIDKERFYSITEPRDYAVIVNGAAKIPQLPRYRNYGDAQQHCWQKV